MAQIKCPICGNEISTSDTKCLKCGSDKTTIEFELKKKQFIKQGKINDPSKKKKTIVIIIELILIIAAFTTYFIIFLPRVSQTINDHKKETNKKECTEYSDDWNADLNQCISES